jgi:hypothetical protein
MIGTWNVAGRVPSDDLDLDQWLCTQEPADLYVLGYVPTQKYENVSFNVDLFLYA